MSITHKFVSSKSEQPDTTLVGSNEWNAAHSIGSGAVSAAGVAWGVGQKAPSYIITVSGGTVNAINGWTGVVDYSGSDSAVIQSAMNNLLSGGLVLVKNGTYSGASGLLIPSNIQLQGESMRGVVIVDTNTTKLPQNPNFGASLSNTHYSVSGYAQNTNISIRNLTIKPNVSGVGIAFGGVDNVVLENIYVDLTVGYTGINMAASRHIVVDPFWVVASGNATYYNNGIGGGLGNSTATSLNNIDYKIGNGTILNITADPIIINGGNESVFVHDCYILQAQNTITATADAFVDIEGNLSGAGNGMPSRDIHIERCMFYNPNTGLAGGLSIGGVLGNVLKGVYIRDNVFAPASGYSVMAVGSAISIGGSGFVSDVFIERNTWGPASRGATYTRQIVVSGINGKVVYRKNYYLPNGGNLNGNPFWGIGGTFFPAQSGLSVSGVSDWTVTDNEGVNPTGFLSGMSNALIPAPGSANKVINTFGFPVMVYQSGANGTHIIDYNAFSGGFQSHDFALPDPTAFLLPRAAAVYYATSGPQTWAWYGL